MAIHVQPVVDPLSTQTEAVPIIAESTASRLVQHELERYCNRQSQGCSILIAGHRGSGKTTLVNGVLRKVQDLASSQSVKRRPLPIFLHGPSLFRPEPARPAPNDELWSRIFDQKPTTDEGDNEVEQHTQYALVQIILGLHKGVIRAFADAMHARANNPQRALQPTGRPHSSRAPAGRNAELRQNVEEWPELAAEFEIELMEDPSASRLREFYDSFGALETGILHLPLEGSSNPMPPDQGARELVALNGICTAHQRISGTMSGRESNHVSEKSEHTETNSLNLGELVKPLVTVLSGAVVLGGAAAGQHDLLPSAALGITTALTAGLVMKRTSTKHEKRAREVDRTFIPDLSLRTLDRVLPTLMERLKHAGLAPVLVIDELDKMDELCQRLETMTRYLKKLMAENVFSCFLTDRGYLEYLTHNQRERAYGPIYSYFTHAVFVCYQPRDLDAYLDRLLDAQKDDEVENDRQLLKWVLRHRSQMHALDLTREILALRTRDPWSTPGTPADTVELTTEEIRQSPVFTIDITLQVAIEHQLGKRDIDLWLQQLPLRRLVLMDALYHISREWRRDAPGVDLSESGLANLWRILERRMNLDELGAIQPDGVTDSGMAEESATSKPILSDADKAMLQSIVLSLAGELSRAQPSFRFPQRSREPGTEASVRSVAVRQNVLLCVRHGNESVLEADKSRPAYFNFRKRVSEVMPLRAKPHSGPRGASNAAPDEIEPSAERVNELLTAAQEHISFIDEFEVSLRPILFERVQANSTHDVFKLLAETYGILPTDRPATQMAAARRYIREIIDLDADPQTLAQSAEILEKFRDMLTANFEVLHAAIVVAAVVSQLKKTRPAYEAINKGLETLSSGLLFNELDTPSKRRMLADFQMNLVSTFFQLSPSFDANSWDRTDKSGAVIVAGVEVANKLAAISRDSFGRWSSVEIEAWMYYGIVLGNVPSSGSRRPYPFELIVCAANGVGPALVFERRPFNPTIEDWTRLIMSVLNAHDDSTKDEGPPALVLQKAMTILGFNMVFEHAVVGYFEHLNNSTKMRRHASWIQGGFEITAGMGDPDLVNQVAIVLKSSPRSQTTDSITSAPFQPLLVTTADALETASDEFLHLVCATGTVQLIWEDNPAAPVQEKLKKLLTKNRDNVVITEALLRQTRYR
ncbi:hypothetical protein [Caballeronia sp. BR00000012568055]|uniref:hypothetical protein n=1 Tax=Caballeronia sp. BR00000012568055 TaxID=2918761 RepID=UPI0023F94549|nr:hypothetical protein [Caballeronia sp. BR00000012568055]